MKDRYEREINYMRVSVTDRCNLRCRYCMPEGGIESAGCDEILRFDEILRIIGIAAGLGVENIRITGGEPLVRKDIPSLIKDIKALKGIKQVTLTTNGVLLEKHLEELVRAGLDGVNISLDTLEPAKYRQLTGGDCLKAVKKAVAECGRRPDLKTKINVVSIREFNDGEILSLVEFASQNGADIRFIEMMPIGMGKLFKGYSQDDIMRRLEASFGTAQGALEMIGNGPAVYYKFEKLESRVGFISALSHRFCNQCNRIRLTAEGILKPCLQYADGIDVKEAVRSGKSQTGLKEMIEECIFKKPLGHEFCSLNIRNEESNMMSKIGG